MDPLHTTPIEKDKIVIVGQKEIEKKKELIGTRKVIKGHTIFEINLKERTIEPAQFEETAVAYPTGKPTSKGLGIMQRKDGSKKMVLDALPSIKRTIIKKPDCIYISALNRKNVIKKLVKRGIIEIKKS